MNKETNHFSLVEIEPNEFEENIYTHRLEILDWLGRKLDSFDLTDDDIQELKTIFGG